MLVGFSSAGGAGPTTTPHGDRPTAMVFTVRSVEVSTTLTSFDGPFAV